MGILWGLAYIRMECEGPIRGRKKNANYGNEWGTGIEGEEGNIEGGVGRPSRLRELGVPRGGVGERWISGIGEYVGTIAERKKWTNYK